MKALPFLAVLLISALSSPPLAGAAAPPAATAAPTTHAEVVIYGGTPAGIMAAIAAAQGGHTVALIDINRHIGGVVSGGLVDTDIGDPKTVGGLAAEFFARVQRFYRNTYGPDSPQFAKCRNGWRFEAHVAEMIFEAMLQEQPRVTLWRDHRFRSATLSRAKVTTLIADDRTNQIARTFTGDVFIDASYEGDLMAGARVPYRVGRESRAEFGESLAGISAGPPAVLGLGDHRTQAYNYRVTLTWRTENRVLFPKPEHYDPAPWRATYGARILRGGVTQFARLYARNLATDGNPNDKVDTNWCDLVGGSEGYADGDWETRDRIAARHRDYFLSMLYYLQNDPELPEAFRADMQKWGLPKDDFADQGHFPFQLYVREARRMIGRYVLREQDLTQDRWKPDGVATGSYGIDCHVVQRVLAGGRLVADHTRHTAVNNYDIPYGSLVPAEVENLLVPVCLSATHVAYCSLRMEPVYMMLGQASGKAAHLALAGKTTVQKVNPQHLREQLRQDGAILDAGYQPPVQLSWSPPRPKAGEAVTFAAVSGPLLAPLRQICWDFTGSGGVSAEGERVVHAFDREKMHNVSLLVIDAAGRRHLVTAEIPVESADARDVTVDDLDAALTGRWNGTIPESTTTQPLRSSDVFLGVGIQRSLAGRGADAGCRARFQPTLTRSGRYRVCLGFRPAKDQATNTPVAIHHAGGVTRVTVNQREPATPFNFVPLGEFTFQAGRAAVEVSNAKADGIVAIDGVRWIWLSE